MQLAAFIVADLEQILGAWERSARITGPHAQQSNPQTLRDHAGELLLSIARDLSDRRQEASESENAFLAQLEVSKEIAAVAAKHGATRAELGFTLQEMVAEFPLLRSVVTRRWLHSHERAPDRLTSADVEDLIHFSERLDVALADSLAEYDGRVNASRDLFLGVLGHDLRDPLGTVIVAAQLALEQPLDDTTKGLMQRIVSIGNRMQQMIRDLLDFTRGRLAGGIPVECRPTDLREVVRAAADEYATLYREHPINVETSGDLEGEWDPPRIQQALSNLLGNAAQHGDPRTPIELRAAGDHEDVMIAVHNEGPPISAARMDEIFDPVKIVSARTRGVAHDRNHLGLGLYIAREIISGHHGTIDVDSSAERGTTFTIHLPRHA